MGGWDSVTQKTRNKGGLSGMPLNTVLLAVDTMLYSKSPELTLHKLTMQYCILKICLKTLCYVFLPPNSNSNNNNIKEDRRNVGRCRMCLWLWWWWWFHGYICGLELIELYALNMPSFLHTSHTSIRYFFFKRILHWLPQCGLSSPWLVYAVSSDRSVSEPLGKGVKAEKSFHLGEEPIL